MIPQGINVSKIERGMSPAELKIIVDELASKHANVYLVPSKVGNIDIVDGNVTVGRIEFRNDLGFTGLKRLVINA